MASFASTSTAVCLLAALLLLAAPTTHAMTSDVISGYWASSLGSGKAGQTFACTTGELGVAVSCTGVSTGKDHGSIVAVGYRLSNTAYSMFFSGSTGGNYTLVVATENEIVNYPAGKVLKSTPKKDLYIWRRIA